MAIQKTVVLAGGRKLHLAIGNLLEEPVDAIVNAANGHLSHGGGVAGAIARAAGTTLDQESRKYVKDHGPVPTGSAVVTTAGKLPYQGVIHAVGPRMGDGQEEEKVASAVAASLACAHQRSWCSVAMPAISSGIFGVPVEICARGYIRGVQNHLAQYPDSAVKEIRITVFPGPIVNCIEMEMDKIKGAD